MNFLNIHTDFLRSELYLGAEPLERATWLNLMAWCASQENGGVIEGADEWTDRKWQQLCGVTLEEVKTMSGLYGFEDGNLVVKEYPAEKEAEVKAKREAGKKGGRPKKDKAPEPLKNKEKKPHGSNKLKAKPNHQPKTVKTERKGREGNGMEWKDKENEKKEAGASALPFVSESFSKTWSNWLQHLKEKRKTPTASTRKRQLKILAELTEAQAVETIERSITNGWQGLFPQEKQSLNPKINKKGASQYA